MAILKSYVTGSRGYTPSEPNFNHLLSVNKPHLGLTGWYNSPWMTWWLLSGISHVSVGLGHFTTKLGEQKGEDFLVIWLKSEEVSEDGTIVVPACHAQSYRGPPHLVYWFCRLKLKLYTSRLIVCNVNWLRLPRFRKMWHDLHILIYRERDS